MSEDIEVGTILIRRVLTSDGADDLVGVETTGEISYLETVGMLIMALQVLDRRARGDDHE